MITSLTRHYTYRYRWHGLKYDNRAYHIWYPRAGEEGPGCTGTGVHIHGQYDLVYPTVHSTIFIIISDEPSADRRRGRCHNHTFDEWISERCGEVWCRVVGLVSQWSVVSQSVSRSVGPVIFTFELDRLPVFSLWSTVWYVKLQYTAGVVAWEVGRGGECPASAGSPSVYWLY